MTFNKTTYWNYYAPDNLYYGGWKLHIAGDLNRVEECENLKHVISGVLVGIDVPFKTLNSDKYEELKTTKQNGKLIAVYLPFDKQKALRVIKTLEFAIEELYKNKLINSLPDYFTIQGSRKLNCKVDRIYYRYDFKNKEFGNTKLNLLDNNDYIIYNSYYEPNRGDNKYLSEDMNLEDDFIFNYFENNL